MSLALYAGSHRFITSGGGRETRHSFSFGEHYDPANLGFGPMVCHNDDLLAAGGGYPDHPHADTEIVTWVLDGVLLHTDDAGNTETLGPGDVQVMSAGSGIRHAEIADAHSGHTRFIQTWIRPDEPGTAPAWTSMHADPAPGLTTIVGDGGLPLGTRGASLSVARLTAGTKRQLPDAGLQHLFVARGAGRLEARPKQVLDQGDAVRLVDEPGVTLEATTDIELLVWSFTH